jgi:hypothetical protein
LLALEERALLNGAMPSLTHGVKAAARAADVKPLSIHPAVVGTSDITIINATNSKGFHFVNFDGPNAGTTAGTGTNMNGISNAGVAVGFTIDNNGNFTNFTAVHWNPRAGRILTQPATTGAMAFGINSAGVVVGTDGNGNAFFLYRGVVKTFIPPGGTSATAFGINDHNTIVGQYVTATASPGFVRLNASSFVTINAPSGPNTVNAQGINNNGLVVGFYVGTDGQDHGFIANARAARNGVLTGTPVADPVIPAVPGEPGATFVFSQILGINDHGIAVGYYGDSTGSQHGFLYNTRTGKYTFLDDPSEAFNNGVEVTQITGITNSGEITGFYSDANGVFHGFAARPL